MNPTPIVLHVQALYAGYGTAPMLQDVTLKLHAGEIVGVLGHNGMGKTTLMKTLIGHLPTTSGVIQLNGQPVQHLPAHQRARLGLAYVPQGREIFPALSVQDNLAIAAVAARQSVAAALDQALADFPVLAKLLNRKGGMLSGGEQQILALARALCGQPAILLLDEPSEGIQPSIVDEIEAHLRRLACERDLAVLVVEQDAGFIRATARRVLWLQKGRILCELDPDQLAEQTTLDALVGLQNDAPESQP